MAAFHDAAIHQIDAAAGHMAVVDSRPVAQRACGWMWPSPEKSQFKGYSARHSVERDEIKKMIAFAGTTVEKNLCAVGRKIGRQRRAFGFNGVIDLNILTVTRRASYPN